LVVVGCLDDEGSCGGGGEAVLVGGDVVDDVGLGGVELDGVRWDAVDVGGDAEIAEVQKKLFIIPMSSS
jgi:hypothetical protein